MEKQQKVPRTRAFAGGVHGGEEPNVRHVNLLEDAADFLRRGNTCRAMGFFSDKLPAGLLKRVSGRHRWPVPLIIGLPGRDWLFSESRSHPNSRAGPTYKFTIINLLKVRNTGP